MGTARKLLLSALVIGVTGACAGFSTFSAFTGTTSNTGNTFATGTVTIDDNDAGGAMYNVSDALPGVPTVKCIKVTYTGSLASDVALYTPSTLDPSAQYVDLTIEKGTGNAAFPDCTGFTPESTIFSGTLGGFASAHTDFGSGVASYPGSQTEWDTNDSAVYRFTLSVQNVAAAQAITVAAHTFTWEAQNQ